MGFWDRFLRKKEHLVPFSLDRFGVDIHSHLIPGIDDGSKSLDESINLAKGFVGMGYRKIVTTPHIMSDFYRNTPEVILSGLSVLQEALVSEQIPLTVEAAAEYYIDFEFSKKIAREPLLTFGDKYVLVECSFVEPPKNIKEVIFELQTNGYKPILAHPERYPYWHRDKEMLFDLKNRDVLFQVNLLSLVGMYSLQVMQIAEYLLENNMVEWLATDLHNANQLAMLRSMQLKESVLKQINDSSFLNNTL